MKKLLSLSLAIVMMLSCVLGQAVLVNAADEVDSTNAPYAGVYQVTSDKAVTLTNETGHTVTLAAGAADYFYLIKGANNITTTDSTANVTFTVLEDNGMEYVSEVDAEVPLTNNRYYYGRTSDGDAVGKYVISKDDSVTVASDNTAITVPAGASVVVNAAIPADNAGIYTLGIRLNDSAINTIRMETDTGFYGEIQQIAGADFDEVHTGTSSDAQVDVEQVYLREGNNYITITNLGSADATVEAFRVYKTAQLATLTQYNWALSYEHFKVVVAETVEPTPTATPEPGETAYTASYAGVYAISADAAATVTSEIGSVVELASDEIGYIYLLKGANVLTNSTSANLTITELEGNGLAYLDQVTAEIPLASSSISELTISGNFTNAQGSYTDYGATGVALGVKASVDVTLTAPAAGLYVTQIQFVNGNADQITVESDTGFYGVINQQSGRVGWNELHQGEHGVGQQDIEIMFLRAGANTITIKNTGDEPTLITKIKLAKTSPLASLEAYNWQLNVENLKPVLPYVESFVNDTGVNINASELAFFGKVGAEYLDFKYGIEFTTNKSGTRAQKYYGAKSGDTVSDGAEGTTVFTFDEWDGSFEIILQGVSLGEKEYRFFVGDDYTDYATVTVE